MPMIVVPAVNRRRALTELDVDVFGKERAELRAARLGAQAIDRCSC